MSSDGIERSRNELRAREQQRAEIVNRLFRAVGTQIDSLELADPLRAELLSLLNRYGAQYGMTLASYAGGPRGTLLDAKVELEERFEELGLNAFAPMSDEEFRIYAEGTAIRREELETVSPQVAGRHIRMNVDHPTMASGIYACGVVAGALTQSWRW